MAIRLTRRLSVVAGILALGALARADDPAAKLARAETKLDGDLSLWSVTPSGKFVAGMSGDNAVVARWKGDRYQPAALGPVKSSIGFALASPDERHLLVQTTNGIESYSVAPFEKKWSHRSGIRAGLLSSDNKSLYFLNDTMLCALQMSDGKRGAEKPLPFLNYGVMAWSEPDALLVLPGIDARDASINIYSFDVRSKEIKRHLPLAGAGASYKVMAVSQNGRFFIGFQLSKKEYEVWDAAAKKLVCRIPSNGNPLCQPAISNDGRIAAVHGPTDPDAKPRPKQMGLILYQLPNAGGGEAKCLGPVGMGKAILSRWVIRDDIGKLVVLTSNPAMITAIDLPK